MLPETIGKIIGTNEAEQQAQMLIDAHNVEWLVSEFDPADPARAERLAEIDRASGIFKALATSMRAAS